MNRIRYCFYCMFFMILSAPAGAQEYSFPSNWEGHYEGSLEIIPLNGNPQNVDMTLTIHELNDTTYQWVIGYVQDTINDQRNYELIIDQEQENHFVIDEKNGIILDAYLIDQKLVSIFDVMSNQLITTYQKVGESIIFEILMYKNQAVRTSGGNELNDIPLVQSYQPVVFQKAILVKK